MSSTRDDDKPINPDLRDTRSDDRVRCRACGCPHLPVYYTRQRRDHVLRVRFCRHCGRRRVTKESEI